MKLGSVDAPDSREVSRAMGASLTTARRPARSRLCAQPLSGKEHCDSAPLPFAALPCTSLPCYVAYIGLANQGLTAPNAQYCAGVSVHDPPDALCEAVVVIHFSLNSDERRRQPPGSWISSRPCAEFLKASVFCCCCTVRTGPEESEPLHMPTLSTVGFSLRCPSHGGVMFAKVQSTF